MFFISQGLEKLVEATQSVNKLSKDLAVKEKELAVASKKADQVLAEVTLSAQAAEKIKGQVLKVKDKSQTIVDEISVSMSWKQTHLFAFITVFLLVFKLYNRAPLKDHCCCHNLKAGYCWKYSGPGWNGETLFAKLKFCLMLRTVFVHKKKLELMQACTKHI